MKKLTKIQEKVVEKMKNEGKVIYFDNKNFYLAIYKHLGDIHTHEYLAISDKVSKKTVVSLIEKGIIVEEEYAKFAPHFILK